mgnify:CR=1 FL=1
MKRIYLNIPRLPGVRHIVTDQLPGFLIVNRAAVDQLTVSFPFRLRQQLNAAQIRRLLDEYERQCVAV